MQLAIIAGGKGTRLGLKDIPKPMVEIGGKPLLVHQVELAIKYGFEGIFMLTGHLFHVIEDYFGDGSRFGINIRHVVEEKPLGTAGSVKLLEGLVKERFMVFYGDVMLNMDLRSFKSFDEKNAAMASLVVHPNDHPHDSDLVEVDEDKKVVCFHSKPHRENAYYSNLVSAGAYILSPEVFSFIPKGKKLDFGRDIFPDIVKKQKTLRAYKTQEYVKDMGTGKRLEEVKSAFNEGKVWRYSKENKRPAVFLDLDGTLVNYVPLLSNPQDLELYPFSAKALIWLNRSDHICCLVTNKPVVARSLCSMNGVKELHRKVETLLGKEGAYLNDIYFCPHHPDKGYPGENTAFKIECNCRKPKTGMIEQAAREYNIDMQTSWMIGDTTIDIQTGKNAGIKTVLVLTGEGGRDRKFETVPDLVAENLEEAVKKILCI